MYPKKDVNEGLVTRAMLSTLITENAMLGLGRMFRKDGRANLNEELKKQKTNQVIVQINVPN